MTQTRLVCYLRLRLRLSQFGLRIVVGSDNPKKTQMTLEREKRLILWFNGARCSNGQSDAVMSMSSVWRTPCLRFPWGWGLDTRGLQGKGSFNHGSHETASLDGNRTAVMLAQHGPLVHSFSSSSDDRKRLPMRDAENSLKIAGHFCFRLIQMSITVKLQSCMA